MARADRALRPASGVVRIIERAFDRVLDFDSMAAATAAQFAAHWQRAGRVADLRDTLIAGIALARRAMIATRSNRYFEGLDVPVVSSVGLMTDIEVDGRAFGGPVCANGVAPTPCTVSAGLKSSRQKPFRLRLSLARLDAPASTALDGQGLTVAAAQTRATYWVR